MAGAPRIGAPRRSPRPAPPVAVPAPAPSRRGSGRASRAAVVDQLQAVGLEDIDDTEHNSLQVDVGRIVDVGYGEVSFDSEDCASGASAPAAKLKEGCDPNAALEGLGKPAKWCPLKGEWLDVAPKNNSGKKRKKPE